MAIVLSHPTQYYSPWFRHLAQTTDLELRVFYLWDFGVKATRDPRFEREVKWDIDLLSGYDSEFGPNVARVPGPTHYRGFDNPELPDRLAAWHPSAILIFGYAWLSHLRLILQARRRGWPMILRGDSHLLGRPPPGFLRRLPRRWLFRRFAALLAVGQANSDYYRAYSVPESRIFPTPHSVDSSRFDPTRAETLAEARRIREQLGLAPDTRVVLFAGKFTVAKQPTELLTAFRALQLPRTALVFVGDGPLGTALREQAAAATAGTVHFLPFANQSEMPARYLIGDVFALPSRGFHETWGLAVNEAMHMGRPCLVSDRVGCQQDLVTPGQTGWVFRSDDPADLREKLAAALTADLEPYRERVKERIAGYTYAATTAGLMRALAALPRLR